MIIFDSVNPNMLQRKKDAYTGLKKFIVIEVEKITHYFRVN